MCLCATVNDEEFLRDITGDRRYTVIHCIDINYKHNVDMDQVWGQIYQMKQAGVPYWYNKGEIAEVIAANAEHRVKSDLQFTLETVYNLFPEREPEKWIFAKDIMQDYEFAALTRKMQVTPKSVTQALKGLGVPHKDIQRVAAFRMIHRSAEKPVRAAQPLTGVNADCEDFLQ
jgi:predicted P-loop ATPase